MPNMLNQLHSRYPDTAFWMDSMVVDNIEYGLSHANRGVTTSPTVMSDSIVSEPDLWNERILAMRERFPEKNQNELLWEVMYALAAERSQLLLPLYHADASIDGRFCIQGNVYDYMNVDKILAQSARIMATGKNLVMKIPTTAAGIIAMEEIVYRGGSVMATATSTVSQVLAAGAALYRGLARRKAAGLSTEGIALACAMQLGLPEMCYTNYCRMHGLDVPAEALAYSSVAVAKKAYRLLLERYPLVTFVLSNFETDLHWTEFIGGRMMLTMPVELIRKLDALEQIPEARIDVDIEPAHLQALLDNVPFYPKAYEEDAMQPEEFSSFEGFCRTVNIFMDIYEIGLNKVRKMLLPDPYKGDRAAKY